MGSRVDKFGIPNVESLSEFLAAELCEDDSRLEKVLERKLTSTEKSAADSMGSEHASYAASRDVLARWLPKNGPNHFKAIGDEAAATAFFVGSNGTISLVYSSESHNSPSYVCAHPGAATGAGGNERDDVVQSGRFPATNLEARRQGHPSYNKHNDPIKQHVDETTRGIADYANAMGIPHGDGNIKFDPRYAGNNLVNVMSISVTPKSRLLKNKVPTTDDPSKFLAIYLGKASDTTGLGGTKFASVATDMTNTDLNEKAVQDPDPHLQWSNTRGIEAVVTKSLEEGWSDMISYKDMGAAGLLCGTLEQLHGDIGVVINGDLVPQNNPLSAMELLETETQERNVIYVHEDFAHKVLEIFNDDVGLPSINLGAAAAVIGRCNDTGRYTFLRNGVIEVDIPTEDLKEGPLTLNPFAEPKSRDTSIPDSNLSMGDVIEIMFESINFKSEKYVYGHYDQHVGSTNKVKRGEGAAFLRIHEDFEGKVGYSGSFDSNCVYGLLDPKFQAEDSLVRGAFAMAAVGCSVIGVSNNANYGRTSVPKEMWEFQKGQEGVAKAARSWDLAEDYLEMVMQDPHIAAKFENDPRRHVTVNSGNASLNKANANTGTAIPPTTILGLVGWTNAPDQYATWDLKAEESVLVLVGARQKSLAGSDYLQSVHGPECLGDKLFEIDYETSQREVNAIIDAVRSGYVSAANNIEEGGLCNAVAEMVANTSHSVYVNVNSAENWGDPNLTDTQKLFSESYGMVMQVSIDKLPEFDKLMREQDVETYHIGEVMPAEDNGLVFNTQHQIFKATQRDVTNIYNNKMKEMLNEA